MTLNTTCEPRSDSDYQSLSRSVSYVHLTYYISLCYKESECVCGLCEKLFGETVCVYASVLVTILPHSPRKVVHTPDDIYKGIASRDPPPQRGP